MIPTNHDMEALLWLTLLVVWQVRQGAGYNDGCDKSSYLDDDSGKCLPCRPCPAKHAVVFEPCSNKLPNALFMDGKPASFFHCINEIGTPKPFCRLPNLKKSNLKTSCPEENVVPRTCFFSCKNGTLTTDYNNITCGIYGLNITWNRPIPTCNVAKSIPVVLPPHDDEDGAVSLYVIVGVAVGASVVVIVVVGGVVKWYLVHRKRYPNCQAFFLRCAVLRRPCPACLRAANSNNSLDPQGAPGNAVEMVTRGGGGEGRGGGGGGTSLAGVGGNPIAEGRITHKESDMSVFCLEGHFEEGGDTLCQAGNERWQTKEPVEISYYSHDHPQSSISSNNNFDRSCHNKSGLYQGKPMVPSDSEGSCDQPWQRVNPNHLSDLMRERRVKEPQPGSYYGNSWNDQPLGFHGNQHSLGDHHRNIEGEWGNPPMPLYIERGDDAPMEYHGGREEEEEGEHSTTFAKKRIGLQAPKPVHQREATEDSYYDCDDTENGPTVVTPLLPGTRQELCDPQNRQRRISGHPRPIQREPPTQQWRRPQWEGGDEEDYTHTKARALSQPQHCVVPKTTYREQYDKGREMRGHGSHQQYSPLVPHRTKARRHSEHPEDLLGNPLGHPYNYPEPNVITGRQQYYNDEEVIRNLSERQNIDTVPTRTNRRQYDNCEPMYENGWAPENGHLVPNVMNSRQFHDRQDVCDGRCPSLPYETNNQRHFSGSINRPCLANTHSCSSGRRQNLPAQCRSPNASLRYPNEDQSSQPQSNTHSHNIRREKPQPSQSSRGQHQERDKCEFLPPGRDGANDQRPRRNTSVRVGKAKRVHINNSTNYMGTEGGIDAFANVIRLGGNKGSEMDIGSAESIYINNSSNVTVTPPGQDADQEQEQQQQQQEEEAVAVEEEHPFPTQATEPPGGHFLCNSKGGATIQVVPEGGQREGAGAVQHDEGEERGEERGGERGRERGEAIEHEDNCL